MYVLQEFGDGIMSAIDMFATVDDVVGSAGEKRMVITLNGKVMMPLSLHGHFKLLGAVACLACNFGGLYFCERFHRLLQSDAFHWRCLPICRF